MQKIELNADTPLSALFRETHHEMLRNIIENWRTDLILEDDPLKMTTFRFDFNWMTRVEIYMDLISLINDGGLKTPMNVLAHYMFTHSNLSQSEHTLYCLLKRYKGLCKKK